MEPSLRHGDVVLVRKCEPGILTDSLIRMFTGDREDEEERARLRRYERMGGDGMSTDNVGEARLYQNPPTALSGHVVVYKNPECGFPTELCVKRVIGLGGQWMQSNPRRWDSNPLFYSNSRYSRSTRRLQCLPPFTLHVEGDNEENSRDSRQYGPISKNLLVGLATHVIWPPTRWQRIHRIIPTDEIGEPRAAIWG